MNSVSEALAWLQPRIRQRPRVALVLGSGLGALADDVQEAQRFDYNDIPGFAPVGVEGHQGVLVSGRLEGVSVAVLQGRYHLYEGHSPGRAVVPVRVARALGAGILIVTNAAGGTNPAFRSGDLMIIDDHINMMWRNPLIGPVQDGETRFPDMSQPYDRDLQCIAMQVAAETGQRVVRGVYCGMLGPSYETPAEVRMCRAMGADAIGMSTVPEVIAARAGNMRVLGISLISNPAAGLSSEPLVHDEVIRAGKLAAGALSTLVRGILSRLKEA